MGMRWARYEDAATRGGGGLGRTWFRTIVRLSWDAEPAFASEEVAIAAQMCKRWRLARAVGWRDSSL